MYISTIRARSAHTSLPPEAHRVLPEGFPCSSVRLTHAFPPARNLPSFHAARGNDNTHRAPHQGPVWSINRALKPSVRQDLCSMAVVHKLLWLRPYLFPFILYVILSDIYGFVLDLLTLLCGRVLYMNVHRMTCRIVCVRVLYNNATFVSMGLGESSCSLTEVIQPY